MSLKDDEDRAFDAVHIAPPVGLDDEAQPTVVEPEQKPAQPAAAQPAANVAAPAPEAATTTKRELTEEEVVEMLAARERLKAVEEQLSGFNTKLDDTSAKVWGKFGDVERKLGPRATGKVTRELLPTIAQEWGPEVADALATDLSAILGSPAEAVAPPDPVEAFKKYDDEKISPRFQEFRESMYAELEPYIQRRIEISKLNDPDIGRPEWLNEINSNEFKAWTSTLPKDEQQQIADYETARDVLKTLRRWDDHLAAVNKRDGRRQRLSAAVPGGDGAGGPAASRNDSEDYGFANPGAV